MLGIFRMSIFLEEYLCVDLIKLMRGELETVASIFGRVEWREMVDIEELYEKSNKIELIVYYNGTREEKGIVEAKDKRIFEKILEIMIENEQWVILELRRSGNSYIWKVALIEEKTINEIKNYVWYEEVRI